MPRFGRAQVGGVPAEVRPCEVHARVGGAPAGGAALRWADAGGWPALGGARDGHGGGDPAAQEVEEGTVAATAMALER